MKKAESPEQKKMESLVTENMGLAGYTAKRFLNTGIEYEELYSLAYLGLTKAAKSFKAEKGRFTTYALRVMQNEILMYRRQNKKHRQCVSYDAMMCSDNEDTNAFLCIFGQEDPELARVENIGLYDFLTEDLSEQEKQVVDLAIIGGTLQTDVGHRLGVSQSYISRIERRAIEKIKQKMTLQLCKTARS